MSKPDAQRQLASLSLAVLLLGPGQKIASVNPAAESLLGKSTRRLSGMPLNAVLRFDEPLLRDKVADPDVMISARESEISIVGRPQGQRVDVTVAPVIDQPGWQVLTLHELGGAEGLGDDAAGGQDAALRAPAILAHEIKNPLAGIRGAAQLLARKLKGNDLAMAGLIADEVDRIAKLIDQMQTLSRRSSDPVGPCNLHEALRRATAVINAGGDAPRIREEFDPSLPMVLGNADALVQVLINLLANARDACRGTASPKIAVRTRFASGLQLRTASEDTPVRLPIEVRVSDNGPGIEPQMRDHVFEPFVTSKQHGQGLGLALVRRLVRDMNGRISHDRDEEGGWTHFRIHLQLATEKQANRKERAA